MQKKNLDVAAVTDARIAVVLQPYLSVTESNCGTIDWERDFC
jgi:hypothetical protein